MAARLSEVEEVEADEAGALLGRPENGSPEDDGSGPATCPDSTWRDEFWALALLAAPTVVQSGSQQAMLVVDQVFLGHLGTSALAAASLGITYSNIMWFFLLGAATALDTLGAQAFGANNRGALVTATLTAGVVLSVLTALVSVGLCFGEPVAALAFGQDKEVSGLVGTYCYGLIPGMWPLMLGVVLMKYLQAQNQVMAPALVTVVAFFLNIGLNVLFINWLGFQGSPLATSVSRLVQTMLLVLAVIWHERVSQGDSPDAAHGSPRKAKSGGSGGGTEDEGRGLLQMQPLRPTPEAAEGGSSVADADADELLPVSVNDVLPASVAAASARAPGAGNGDGGGPNGHHSGGMHRQLSWLTSPVHRTSSSSKLLHGAAKPGAPGGRVVASVVGAWQRLAAATSGKLMWRFLALALPGGLMMAFEAGSFDVTTVMAGHLGPVTTAAHSALLGIIGLSFVAMPFAIATAATIRVGNLMGAGRPRAAHKCGYLAVGSSGAFMLLSAIALVACRWYIGYMFSTDEDVIEVMAGIAPFAALFQVSDGLMGSSSGVLRGVGKQMLMMVFNLVGFWMCGVLLGYLLCFHAGLGIHGVWIGIASGVTSTGIMTMITMLRLDWEHEARIAQERSREHHEHPHGAHAES